MDQRAAAQVGRPAAPGAGTLPAGLGGLSTSEALKRLQIFGPNRIGAPSSAAKLKEWLWTLADPMASMLAVGGAVYLALGERREGTVLLLAVLPVLGIDVLMEMRSRRALKSLAFAAAPRAKVVRDGVVCEIPTEELAPGDLLVIAEGDIVHADAVVRWAANLAVDESHLSGESEPQLKTPSTEANCVYAGSRVIAGHGYAEVTATGRQSRLGAIARLAQQAQASATPLQRKIGRMTVRFLAVALIASAAIFGVKLSRGEPLNQTFLYAISMAMSAIPEEFLLVFTLFLSVCAWRLSHHRVLVRHLTSVETLGSTTVICLDKTGTLTRGTFALQVHLVLDPETTELALLEAAVLACEPHPADPMEQAIVAHCAEHGINVPRLHAQWALACDYPFDPVGKHMSHVWRRVDGRHNSEPPARIVAKGALEGILAHCRLRPGDEERAEAANAELAAAGIRVLAIASRPAPPEEPDSKAPLDGFTGSREQDEYGLRLHGLVGFQDPLRHEVVDAIRECQQAGIKLKLVTGDHLLTAHAVAEAAGIAHHDDQIQSAEVIEGLRGRALVGIVERTPIFGRAQPEQKFAIVGALRTAGEIVAMTGDGINDAPALRRADIGVSMGRRGTEVAREASDLILLDDDFSALVVAIREGRRVFADIQRAFLYLVAFKTMVVGLALSAPLLGLPILLAPVDLVWLELIVHPVSALVFDSGTGAELLMRKPPRDPGAPIIPWLPGLRSAISGALLAAGALWLYHLRLGYGEPYARGTAMAVIVAGSLLLAASELYRNPVRPAKQAVLGLRFWAICLPVAASLPLFMAVGPAANLLGIAWIGPLDFGLALLTAALAVGWQGLVADSPSASDKITGSK